MPAYNDGGEIDIRISDHSDGDCRRAELVSLGSAPTIQRARTVRLLVYNLSTTQATGALIFINIGKLTIPYFVPPQATPILNDRLEIHNGVAPMEISDFTIPPAMIPPGMTGGFFLLLVEH